MNPKFSMTSLLAAIGLMSLAAAPALAIDWAGVPAKDVMLLYPGQSSLEWTRTAGKTFTVGFAIHAGHTARRFHDVSVEQSLVLDQGTGEFVAGKK